MYIRYLDPKGTIKGSYRSGYRVGSGFRVQGSGFRGSLGYIGLLQGFCKVCIYIYIYTYLL